MTIAVMVDGELRTGSSVVGAQLRASLRDKGWNYGVIHRGKFPIVDLGPKGWLIATSHHYVFNSDISDSMANKNQSRYRNPYQIPYQQLHPKLPRIDLTDAQYPKFIWVPRDTNLRDAKSLEPREFGQVIGAGIWIDRITVEPTSDPLGWPPDFKEPEWVTRVLALKSAPLTFGPAAPKGYRELRPMDIERE